MNDIQPFHVMALLKQARDLEGRGRSIMHLEIGEPDFPTAPAIVQAGITALRQGHTHYTPATGLSELRQAIARSYGPGLAVDPARVVVTPGASGAFQLIFGTLLDPGDTVMMADPGYPCYRHFVRLFEGRAELVPVGADSDYQLSAELVRRHWSPGTRAVLLASPSNPTGTVIADQELGRIVATVEELGGMVIADEIYHGLIYGCSCASALEFSDRVFVVNSFSKYYGMTGWRLGWLVGPAEAVPAIDKLAQNIFLAASTPAQYAALAAFSPAVQAELERRRGVFRQRRDYLLPALRELGFDIPTAPQGAFYIYANCAAFTDDSYQFAQDLLVKAGVAITPGRDFGHNDPQHHLRFSYANTLENLREAVARLEGFLAGR
jgi:aspartate/methionine/tyrosine aminotransferase